MIVMGSVGGLVMGLCWGGVYWERGEKEKGRKKERGCGRKGERKSEEGGKGERGKGKKGESREREGEKGMEGGRDRGF